MSNLGLKAPFYRNVECNTWIYAETTLKPTYIDAVNMRKQNSKEMLDDSMVKS